VTLHLVKLCVGCESIADLEQWIAWKLDEKQAKGLPREQFHTTRMVPRRIADLVGGGSLYWVIKGLISCRQRLLDVRPFTDDEGIGRCHLVLEPRVVPVEPRPRSAFQGWRYFEPNDAPPDLGAAGDLAAMPETLRRELAGLGLL
jgi:hypothetical protein